MYFVSGRPECYQSWSWARLAGTESNLTAMTQREIRYRQVARSTPTLGSAHPLWNQGGFVPASIVSLNLVQAWCKFGILCTQACSEPPEVSLNQLDRPACSP